MKIQPDELRKLAEDVDDIINDNEPLMHAEPQIEHSLKLARDRAMSRWREVRGNVERVQ